MEKGKVCAVQDTQFCWSAKAAEAFECLKEAMTITPILALTNLERSFTLETNALG